MHCFPTWGPSRLNDPPGICTRGTGSAGIYCFVFSRLLFTFLVHQIFYCKLSIVAILVHQIDLRTNIVTQRFFGMNRHIDQILGEIGFQTGTYTQEHRNYRCCYSFFPNVSFRECFQRCYTAGNKDKKSFAIPLWFTFGVDQF